MVFVLRPGLGLVKQTEWRGKQARILTASVSEATEDFQRLQGTFRGCRGFSEAAWGLLEAAGEFQRLQGTFRGCRGLSEAMKTSRMRLADQRMMDSHLVKRMAMLTSRMRLTD